MTTHTHVRTVYRLSRVAPTPDAMLDVFDAASLDQRAASVHFPEALGVPAVYITCGIESDEAPWCAPMARTTGIAVKEPVRRTAAVLLLAVDGTVYGIGCDQGYRLIPDALKDQRFGLSFAIRQMDPDAIRAAVSRSLGQARTDISLVPGGAPVPRLGIREHSRVVRSLGGYLDDVPLTRSRYASGKAVSAQGGVGLKVALGIEPAELLADLRLIAEICREEVPHQELEFVDRVAPVDDPSTLDALDRALDDRLGLPADGRISVSVPSDLYEAYQEAAAYLIRINSTEARRSDGFDLGYVLERARLAQPGRRVAVLREGMVVLAGDPRARDSDTLAGTDALSWLEAEVPLGSRRFFLLEGEWYEAGAAYVEECRAVLAELLSRPPSVDLPAWPAEEAEGDYNDRVPEERPGWLCLDTKTIANPLRRKDQVEICDLLTPDDTLVMVKRAGGSGALSHLFGQAMVAVELTREDARVRADFSARVKRVSDGGRHLPEDFTPRRIVLAVQLKSGKELTPDSLFGFSQITAAQTVKALAARGVTVELVGVPTGAGN